MNHHCKPLLWTLPCARTRMQEEMCCAFFVTLKMAQTMFPPWGHFKHQVGTQMAA